MAELRRNFTDFFEESLTADSLNDQQTTPIKSKNLLLKNSRQREMEVTKLREELYCFLNRPIVYESIYENRSSVYRMITSHVDFETELYLANKLKGNLKLSKDFYFYQLLFSFY